jgi:hypothetical protein
MAVRVAIIAWALRQRRAGKSGQQHEPPNRRRPRDRLPARTPSPATKPTMSVPPGPQPYARTGQIALVG